MKRRLLYIIRCIALLPLLLGSCDVHEWPEAAERVSFYLRLRYETEMTEWEHRYDGKAVTEVGLGRSYDNALARGEVRTTVRAYPVQEKLRSAQTHTDEANFTRDMADGYDCGLLLSLSPADYTISVWSGLAESGNAVSCYNAADFAEITLQGSHEGNNLYRDAFRGSGRVSLVADVWEQVPDTLEVTMQRPLAKFEFITNDVRDFIEKETTRVATKGGSTKSTADGEADTRVSLDDYRVVFYYVGFMPCAYSLFTDKPVDSATGVLFESTLNRLSEEEASLGFDYVLVNGTESAVTVQIGIYDNEETLLSLTDPITVPLKRNRHTVLRGMFLMSEASGGVTINPGYEGDHNIVFSSKSSSPDRD